MPRELAYDLAALALYDIVIYCDDSGSMTFEENGGSVPSFAGVMPQLMSRILPRKVASGYSISAGRCIRLPPRVCCFFWIPSGWCCNPLQQREFSSKRRCVNVRQLRPACLTTRSMAVTIHQKESWGEPQVSQEGLAHPV